MNGDSEGLREGEERYRTLFNSIDEGLCVIEMIFDANEKPVDYRFLEINPAFEAQTGLLNALGRTMREMLPEHEQSWFDIYGRVAKTGEPVRFENYSSLLNRWFSLYGFRVGAPAQQRVAVIFTNITARKAEEMRAVFLMELSKDLASFHLEEEILYTAVHAVGKHLGVARCYFVECMEEENRVRVSEDFLREDGHHIAGNYDLRDLGGIDWWRHLASGQYALDDVEAHRLPPVAVARYRSAGIRAYAAQPFRKEGAWTVVLAVTDSVVRKWTDAELALLDDVAARVWPLVERARVEQALRLSMAEAARAARAKDDFLAALSHELRTPLTPVLMTTASLESDTTLPQEVREQLSMMRRNVELEARLIDDLLDLTRVSHGKLQMTRICTDVHQLLRHTDEIVRSDGLGKQVRIVMALDAERHHALADPTRLQQVFWNLIKNALKFTPAGGTITVSTGNDTEGAVVIRVEDTGIGISAKAMPHIFKAFEQGDVTAQHRYGGLGLGLAISHAIVTAHDGKLLAASEGPGLGATFTVSVPSTDGPAESGAAETPRFELATALRLLIVEDHEATRTVLSRLLRRLGHDVTVAGNLAEAHEYYGKGAFDVVVSDLGLPDGSGLELMRDLQAQRAVYGIALSGYGMEDDVREAREAGFSAHLVKPVNFEQLRMMLEQFAARRGHGEGNS